MFRARPPILRASKMRTDERVYPFRPVSGVLPVIYLGSRQDVRPRRYDDGPTNNKVLHRGESLWFVVIHP